MDEKTVVSSVLNELITLVKHTLSLKANASSLAAVATTGSYNDLSNKPTIPTVPITDISVNGTALTPQDGVVDVQVPTDYVDTGDFEERTGSMRIVLSYSNGVVAIERSGTPLDTLIYLILNNCNVWFLLPTAYITGIPSNTDMMRFWMTGANLDTSAPTISLTSVYNGNVYHAVLSPVSEYRMEGQLNVYNIALPSAESNSFGGA